MTSTIHAVTFDCHDALKLAQFWSAVVDQPIDQGQPEPSRFFASIGRSGETSETSETSETGGTLPMMFIAVPEDKTIKNRVHLDLGTTDRPAEVERLTALGATVVHEKDEWGLQWTTLTDPEGNEFCVAQEN